MKPYISRSTGISLLLFITLVLAAFTPGIVYAEGDIPEAPPPEPILEPAPEQETAGAVEALAESGTVIVEDSGEFVPLASQKALAGINDPDPWFYCSACAGGKATYLGVNSLSTALADWGPKKGYGFIYLEGGYVHNAFLPIDGAMAGRTTLKGIVWDKTTPGAKPRLDAQVYIYSFNNGFTLQGISMTANSTGPSLQFFSNKGTIRLTDVDVKNIGGGGIEVFNQGSIILNGVSANGSKGTGASLTNTYYDSVLEKYINQGGITVTNSEFILNGGPADATNYVGLTVYTAGNVLLSGVTANRNYGNGAIISALGAAAIVRNSTFSSNTADPNDAYYGNGLWITPSTVAAVTLDNVSLFGNENSGAILATTSNILLKNINSAFNGKNGVLISTGPSFTVVGAKNVTVQNSQFFRNTLTGLEIYASGAVKVTNLTSTNSSSGAGLYINNRSYALLPAPVTVMGAVLNNNFGSSGLMVESKGNITVAGITAINNGFTSYLGNQFPNATGSVVVSGALGLNRFNENPTNIGLAIATTRNVSISSIQANGNAYSGLDISANGLASNVTIVNAEIIGNSTASTAAGLWIRASGNVVLNRLTVSDNSRDGINIDNDAASTPRPVTISNTTVNNNREGIIVSSVGAISLVNVTASGNSRNGAVLANQSTGLLPQGISVQKSTFDANGMRGLQATSQRTISLANVNASDNEYNGIYVDNYFGASTSPIVISGINRFTGNGLLSGNTGAILVTNGALTLSGITSSWNGYNGISASSGAFQNTLSKITLQGNSQNGINIATTGKTLLNGVSSFQNGQDGVRISAINAKITIAGSTILGNWGYGLSVDVTTPATDVYVAPSTVIFGNTGGNYFIY